MTPEPRQSDELAMHAALALGGFTDGAEAERVTLWAAEEIDRLRRALTSIRDHGETHDEPCWALHQGDCADAMQEIARAALDG